MLLLRQGPCRAPLLRSSALTAGLLQVAFLKHQKWTTFEDWTFRKVGGAEGVHLLKGISSVSTMHWAGWLSLFLAAVDVFSSTAVFCRGGFDVAWIREQFVVRLLHPRQTSKTCLPEHQHTVCTNVLIRDDVFYASESWISFRGGNRHTPPWMFQTCGSVGSAARASSLCS